MWKKLYRKSRLYRSLFIETLAIRRWDRYQKRWIRLREKYAEAAAQGYEEAMKAGKHKEALKFIVCYLRYKLD